MTNEELDLLVGQASPISDSQVAEFDLGSGEPDLMEAIMSTTLEAPTPAPAPAGQPAGPRRNRRRPLTVVVIAALAAAAASAIGIVAGGRGGPGGGGGSAYAAEIVAVADANERLLIGLPGWSVTRADEFSVEVGEMTFGDGAHEIELRWGPASDYSNFVEDRSDPGSTEQLGDVSVLGRDGLMFRYVGTDEYTTLVEPAGAHYLEVRGNVGGEAAYREVLDSLHSVDVETWLDAMPASVVKPGDRSVVIDQMLVGIPLPAGFDRAALDASASVSDRYQLGAKVTGAVICPWFDHWFTATEQGDTAAAKAASDALVSSHSWPILQEMQAEGAWPQILWLSADATTGGSVPGGKGSVQLTRQGVASAFGCPATDSPTPTTP